MKKIIFVFCLVLLFLFFGCAQKATDTDITTSEKCIALCNLELSKGTDLSAGPCLSNELAAGWVCDVAHSPRTAADDNPANQCSSFREGKASHFVEVDTACKIIKVY